MERSASSGFSVLSHPNASRDVQSNSILTGLIGRHIGASRSPWMHEQEARAQGLSLTYTLFDFAAMGRDESHLCTHLTTADELGFAGVNITYPYKQAVIDCLDELSPGASRVGAVNTVKFTNGRFIGHNTDVVGFAESMRNGLPGAALERVLQLGAGGGGAATLIVCDEDRHRAVALVAKLKDNFGPSRAETTMDPAEVIGGVDGVVNATPLGMAASPQAPIDTSKLARRQWVADIVYFPLETELLKAARERGCRTLDGSRMAVYQAAAAFEIFTGRPADRTRMLRSFVEYSTAQSSYSLGD
jgi:shikimate dehydrogenase